MVSWDTFPQGDSWTEKRAFFWITSGGHFDDEASFSAHQVAKHMPDVPRFLFTYGTASIAKGFNQIGYIGGKKYDKWYMTSTWMMIHALTRLMEDGYRNVVYMDTDTYMVEPVPELFDLPRTFDISGARAPGRKTCTHMEDRFPSNLFPEINIGVNPMFAPTALGLWNTALEAYEKFADDYGDNDQGPLRDAIISHLVNNENFRMYIMPPEYNCRFIMPCFLNGRVKILHGRNPDMAKIINDINAREGMRLWQPYQLVS